MREITFAFIKSASNRQVDDAGKSLEMLYLYYSPGGCGDRRRKEGWQEEGLQMRLIITINIKTHQ